MNPLSKVERRDRTLVAAFIVLLTLANIFSTLRGDAAQGTSHASSAFNLSDAYRRHVDAFETDNEWPIEGLQRAAMTPEESVHYRIETDAGAAEWATTLPRGAGIVFHRKSQSEGAQTYRVSMFHQLSCLSTLRRSLANPVTPPSADTHFCLNYMRESLTCGADAHLEMVRSEYGGRAVLPYTTRTDCIDWERVWEIAEETFDTWAQRV